MSVCHGEAGVERPHQVRVVEASKPDRLGGVDVTPSTLIFDDAQWGVMVKHTWWQSTVIYQIYPRSFYDANGDGIGDLLGITERIDYLAELGVGALWLSPIFTSPMADFGYDIADYTSIDPIFGKMADFDQFLAAAHGRGLKVILDLVPNHTSDQHPWFVESRSSLTNSKRDWYIWGRPGPDGETPNNWLSEFGGSAWELDPVTGQYYYHAFLAAQPDLNWRNPSVRAAIYDVMRFWLARGVDGFRADAMWHLIKDEHFRNNPSHPEFRAGDPPPQAVIPLYTADRPEIHEVIREMRSVVDEFTDRVLIGEIYLPLERLMTYYGRDLDGVHFPFNFSLLSATWHAATIAKIIDEYEAALPHGGWPNWVLGNHDRPRIASRIGTAQARVAAMLLLTLRGTPTIYYGEEIGMEQVEIAPDRIRDPFEINVPGKGLGRDGSRTPMQWDASPFGGFSRVEPWLPIAPQYRSQNVAVQKLQGGSLLLLYQQLLSLRRSRTSVRCGSYLPIETDGDVLLYVRHHENERSLVALNFSSKPAFVPLPADMGGGNVLISTLGNNRQASGGDHINLLGHEGVVIAL